METFSFHSPKNQSEEGKRLLAVKSFEAKSSVFKITDGNIRLSNITSHWIPEVNDENVHKSNNLLQLMSQNDIEFYVEQRNKKKKKQKSSLTNFFLSSLGTFKNEKLQEINNAKYNRL